MRHGRKIHKLSRPREHRRALLNNLAIALITNKQIETTATRAKALKPYIDKLITIARQDTLAARKRVAQLMPNKAAFSELFNVIMPKLEGRMSGFARIVKHRTRKGDGAAMSFVQLMVEKDKEEKAKKKSGKKEATKTGARKTRKGAGGSKKAAASKEKAEKKAEPLRDNSEGSESQSGKKGE